jgi:hypothetical protein
MFSLGGVLYFQAKLAVKAHTYVGPVEKYKSLLLHVSFSADWHGLGAQFKATVHSSNEVQHGTKQ